MSTEPFRHTIDRVRSRFSKAEIVASLKEYGRLHGKSSFRDCWREHGSVPSQRQLSEYLEKHNYPFRTESYFSFFGGLGRLANLIVQVESGKLPESKIYQRHKPARRFDRVVPLKLRLGVSKRDGYRCVKCRATPKDDKSVRLEVDHIMPVARSGPSTMENLQTLCLSCNQGKKDDDD